MNCWRNPINVGKQLYKSQRYLDIKQISGSFGNKRILRYDLAISNSKTVLLCDFQKIYLEKLLQGRPTCLPTLSREVFTKNSERAEERDVYYAEKHRKQSWQRH